MGRINYLTPLDESQRPYDVHRETVTVIGGQTPYSRAGNTSQDPIQSDLSKTPKKHYDCDNTKALSVPGRDYVDSTL